MNTSEKIANVKARVSFDKRATDAIIAVFLEDAKDAILKQRYPFSQPDEWEVPPRYEAIQCKLAARYFLRQGIEGQTVSIENGIHKHYASPDDEDLLKQVMQVVKL